MARMTSMEALDVKIEKAQAQVSKTKKQYDAAVAGLTCWTKEMRSAGTSW